MTGARQFCAIRTYLSTAAKHGLSFFDALVMLANGDPWMPRRIVDARIQSPVPLIPEWLGSSA
jgi:hypothetical protein